MLRAKRWCVGVPGRRQALILVIVFPVSVFTKICIALGKRGAERKFS